MMFRAAGQGIHGRRADVRTIEVDQRALCAASFADVGRRTGLASVQRFLAGLDTCLQVSALFLISHNCFLSLKMHECICSASCRFLVEGMDAMADDRIALDNAQ
jgi:hypothetical protein